MVGIRGVGIDAVDIERFRAVLLRRPKLVQRLFTDRERSDASSRTDPLPSLAARFAAKEAVLKALGVGMGAARFAEVEIVRESGGRPVLALAGTAAGIAESLGVDRWHVSLAHTANLAMASVVCESASGSKHLDGEGCSPEASGTEDAP